MRPPVFESDKYFNEFDDYAPGDRIEIEFKDLNLDGVQIMPRTRLSGILLVPELATLRVESASPELEIDLAELGLAVRQDLAYPPYPGVHIFPTMQHKVAEDGVFSFFNPSDVDHEKIFAKVPHDKVMHRIVRYGHVAVNDTLIF